MAQPRLCPTLTGSGHSAQPSFVADALAGHLLSAGWLVHCLAVLPGMSLTPTFSSKRSRSLGGDEDDDRASGSGSADQEQASMCGREASACKSEVQPLEVGNKFCIMGKVVTVVDVAGSFFVPMSFQAAWMPDACGIASPIFLKITKQLRKHSVLKEIQDALIMQRGKPQRSLYKVDKDNQPMAQCEITVRDATVSVANIAWPIHVAAKLGDLMPILLLLRADAAECAANLASLESPRACADTDEHDIEFATAIDKDSLPNGAFWSSALKSFVVKKTVVTESIVKFPVSFHCRKHAANVEAEIETQRRRAVLLVTTGQYFPNSICDTNA